MKKTGAPSFAAVFLTLFQVSLWHQSDAYNACQQLPTGTPSGVYTLTSSDGVTYQTYCDMETDGGGWTLVASLHENNPYREEGYCTPGDRWSSEQGNTAIPPDGEGTWANLRTFGNVASATSDDFKNPGYFDINAEEIMVWHVPNDTPLSMWRTNSYLRYRTYDGVMSMYGGNLYHLYKSHMPVVSDLDKGPPHNSPGYPVIFDKGTAEDVFALQAPHVQHDLIPGYIQFTSFSVYGYAVAFCPGVQLPYPTPYPNHACIGAAGFEDEYGKHQCGDFPGWAFDGYGTGEGWSVHKQLIETAFLIFYR